MEVRHLKGRYRRSYRPDAYLSDTSRGGYRGDRITDGLRLEEAAELLGVPVAVMYKYVYEGEIPATRKGGHWLVSASDLQESLIREKIDSDR